MPSEATKTNRAAVLHTSMRSAMPSCFFLRSMAACASAAALASARACLPLASSSALAWFLAFRSSAACCLLTVRSGRKGGWGGRGGGGRWVGIGMRDAAGRSGQDVMLRRAQSRNNTRASFFEVLRLFSAAAVCWGGLRGLARGEGSNFGGAVLLRLDFP